MATFTNLSKNSINPSQVSKNSVSTRSNVYTGQGWHYNQPGLTYNGTTDTDTENTVRYNLEGTAISITNLTKN